MIYRILSAPLAQRHDPHPPLSCSPPAGPSAKCSPSTAIPRALSDCTNAAADADPFSPEYASPPAHKRQASRLSFPSAKPNSPPLPPTPPPTPNSSPTKSKSQREARTASLPSQRLRSSSTRVASVTARLKAPPTVRLSLSNASVATSVVPFPSASPDAPHGPISSSSPSKSSPLRVPSLNTDTNVGSIPLPNSPASTLAFPSSGPSDLEDGDEPDVDAMAVDVDPPCAPSLLQSDLAPWSVPARKRRHAHLATPTPTPPRGSAKRVRLLRSLLALDCASVPCSLSSAAAADGEVITDLRALDGILAARLGARGASIGDASECTLSPQQLVASLILQRSERKSSRKKRRAVYTEAVARAEGAVVERRPSPLRAVMVFCGGGCDEGDHLVDGVDDVEMEMEC